MLADVNPAVLDALKKSGAQYVIGAGNFFPATARVLAAEEMAWKAAQKYLEEHQADAKGEENANQISLE
jgi:hypothetical protein